LCGQLNEAGEVDGSPIIAGSTAPEVLEPVEAALDLVAVPVGDDVVRDRHLAAPVGGDDGGGPGER
jgi:hypothetical protein